MPKVGLAGAVLLIAAGLAGCAETRSLGSSIGSGAEHVVATVAGSGEPFLDPRIARPLDAPAREEAAAAQLRALETAIPGVPVTWHAGHFFGTVTAGPAGPLGGSGRCRAFDHTIYLDSRPRSFAGTACRQADGTWQRIAAKAG